MGGGLGAACQPRVPAEPQENGDFSQLLAL
jgi:hypothetical protein